MAFDEIQFPLRVGFGSGGGPEFSTEIVTVEGGFERRTQNWAAPRRRYDAATGLRGPADVAALMTFFHARAGRARGFRLKDWSDYSSAADGLSTPAYGDQVIGTGDGTATQFDLQKTYSSGGVAHVRAIKKPVSGSVVIGTNGTLATSGWSVDTTNGMVTFAAPPESGMVISGGFRFDVPVRFDTDRLTLSTDDFQRSSASIPLLELRLS
jgi:uncharacterized protein (TIGR02217 family)